MKRISIILIVGFIFVGLTGCDGTDLENPHENAPWWYKVHHHRHEKLLKELLIEAQETNAMLQQIVQKLEEREVGDE